jgi:DNA helicase II / ATP-dependent DNA helicase PcrA
VRYPATTTIAAPLLREYRHLSPASRAVVGHDAGPLLVIAGPGSGKTPRLVLRTVSLLGLLCATPAEIALCAFTERVAFELRDRVSAAARRVGYTGDLSPLPVGTIHGLRNRILAEHRHRTPLGSNYETLDDLTQDLFIFDHFDDIIEPKLDNAYLGRWITKWRAIRGATGYFNRITEGRGGPTQIV